MSKRLTGLNPLAYLGVEPLQPTNYVITNRAPTTKDLGGFNIGDEWENSVTQNVYKLVSVHGTVANPQQRTANWVLITGAAGDVLTLTGDTGGPVPPLAGNINLLGTAGGITVTGNPGTHTLTFNIATDVANSFPTDYGIATPVAGILDILGGLSLDIHQIAYPFRQNIHTVATAGNIVDVTLNDYLSFPITNATGTAGVIYSGGVAAANRFISSFGTLNTFVGLGSGNLTLGGAALSNSGFGASTLHSLTTGPANTAVGFSSGGAITTGDNNTSIGYASLLHCTSSPANVAVGANALESLTTGTGGNVAVGALAFQNLLTGVENTALGSAAGDNYATNESLNVCIASAGVVGDNAVIRIGTTAIQTTCFVAGIRGVTTGGSSIPVVVDANGQLGTMSGAAGDFNTFVGFGSGNSTVTGIANSGFGANSLHSLTSGPANTAVGFSSGTAITTADNNTSIGYASLLHATTSRANVAVGVNAMESLTTGTGNNVAVGALALQNLLTGNGNTVLGNAAGDNYTGAESLNICIDSAGVIGDNAVIRIGTTAIQTTCYVAGISGVTTGGAAVPVLVAADGQLGTISSSERYKENIEDIVNTDVLDLKPVRFNYKNQPDTNKSYGLIAEDVDKIMPQLVVYDKDHLPDAVKYHELPVLLLNEIKKLNERILKLEAMNNI